MDYSLRNLPPEWEAFRALCKARGKTAATVLREFIVKTVRDQEPRLNRALFDEKGVKRG